MVFFCRLRGTVITKIWWQIILISLYTAGIICIHNYVPELRMEFKQTLIPILGVVTGLLLVFRTNTAYDRYWEGRRIWGQMTNNIRTLTRGIWTGIKETSSRDIVEKKSVINILVAFAISTKHYLREEYSYDQEDMKDLISHLPNFSTPSSNRPLEKQVLVKRPTFNKKAHDCSTPTNIPIELSYYVATYLSSAFNRGLIDSQILTPMQNALTSLTECLTGFERILRTPIPMAYSVHLQFCVWLYLLALPYQLVNDLNWWTLPAVSLASFALLGILGIGWEIENPFGYDENDLPLDDFCHVIKREIRMIIGSKIPKPEDWVFTPQNHPVAATCKLNAVELSEKSMDEVRKILHDDAQEVIISNTKDIINRSKNKKPEVEETKHEEKFTMLISNN